MQKDNDDQNNYSLEALSKNIEAGIVKDHLYLSQNDVSYYIFFFFTVWKQDHKLIGTAVFVDR